MKKIIIILILMMPLSLVMAQSTYERKTHNSEAGVLPYRILYPDNYDTSKKYPLVLVLHGAGERGNDNESHLIHGSSLFSSDSVRTKFPAIVIFPQCPKDDYWSNVQVESDEGKRNFIFSSGGEPSTAMKMLLSFVDSLKSLQSIDQERMYVGGLSMGGMGTFELLYREPVFAAAFPICGGGSEEMVKSYNKNMSIWVFHGEDDEVVPHELSDKMVAAIEDEDIEVRYSLYPGVNHNSWDNAFSEPELLPWLFSNTLKEKL